MTRRTNDQIADELTNRITAKIAACCGADQGVYVLIDGVQMHTKSEAFRVLIEREYWQMAQRGVKPGVLQQVVRNVEAWAKYGPPAGGALAPGETA